MLGKVLDGRVGMEGGSGGGGGRGRAGGRKVVLVGGGCRGMEVMALDKHFHYRDQWTRLFQKEKLSFHGHVWLQHLHTVA